MPKINRALGSKPPRKPMTVSYCGETERPCSKTSYCGVSYVNSGWFTDEHGNRTRTIEGGVCVRETLPPPSLIKKDVRPRRKWERKQ